MEIIDLYDENRIPLNRTAVRGTELPEGTYRIVIHACIFSSSGQMLIQRRQPFKHGFSGLWDVSCGGGVPSGETSRQAAVRELQEELGLNVQPAELRAAVTLHFVHGFDDMYILNKDVDIDALILQPEEVADAKWASEDEILQMIREGVFIPYHENLIRLLFTLRDQEDGTIWKK